MKKTKFIFTLMLGCSLATMAKAATSYDNCVAAVGPANAANCVQIGTSGTYYALSGEANNRTMTIYGTTGEGSVAASVPTYAFFDEGDSASTLPDGVTSLKTSGSVNIGEYAFHYAMNLTSVDLTGVQTIGPEAFRGATGLTSVDLTGVQTIGDYAFWYATGLTSANLTGVQSIGEQAFSYAEGLTSVDLTGVQSIGNYAFRDATGLTSIIISDSLLDADGNILGYSCDVNNVCAGVDPYAFKKSGLNTIYCPAGKDCENSFTGLSSTPTIISYSKENGKYVLTDGTVIGTYQVATPSGPQPSQPSQPTKPQRADIRIYTIDEANQVAGKTNRVSIRYR